MTVARSCGSEPIEAIPFPGADSTFSGPCGVICEFAGDLYVLANLRRDVLGSQQSSERFKSSARGLQTAFKTFHKISIRFPECGLIKGLRASGREKSKSKAALVRRSRANRSVSKDVPRAGNEAASWTILRDAMRRIAPLDGAVELAPAAVGIILGVTNLQATRVGLTASLLTIYNNVYT
jgi:hypothetical protein